MVMWNHSPKRISRSLGRARFDHSPAVPDSHASFLRRFLCWRFLVALLCLRRREGRVLRFLRERSLSRKSAQILPVELRDFSLALESYQLEVSKALEERGMRGEGCVEND